jgi:hypothetical protein
MERSQAFMERSINTWNCHANGHANGHARNGERLGFIGTNQID